MWKEKKEFTIDRKQIYAALRRQTAEATLKNFPTSGMASIAMDHAN